ncbi:endonuclease [Tenacibaculum sp.]|uniref:endonuclease n=1 Tax=Tenacibaculum sp. TaxID=1906242 RepID=UPI003AA86206
MAERKVYFDRQITFYCQCDFLFDDVDDLDNDGKRFETYLLPKSCGYEPRKPITKKGKVNSRTVRIEWEHVMPAKFIGGHLPQWANRNSFSECRNKKGKYISRRDCAYDLNDNFRRAHDDLVNLVPAVGELNGDRSDLNFAEIDKEVRNYGQCDFEVDFERDVVEPSPNVRGDIARIYFYMINEYNARISESQYKQMQAWSEGDLVDEWECKRNQRILEAQGKGNQLVLSQCIASE